MHLHLGEFISKPRARARLSVEGGSVVRWQEQPPLQSGNSPLVSTSSTARSDVKSTNSINHTARLNSLVPTAYSNIEPILPPRRWWANNLQKTRITWGGVFNASGHNGFIPWRHGSPQQIRVHEHAMELLPLTPRSRSYTPRRPMRREVGGTGL